MRRLRLLTLTAFAVASGCDDELVPPEDFAVADQAVADLAMPDLAMPDLAMPDLAMPDLAMPDLLMPDLAMCTPNAFVSCSGDDAIFCNVTGDGVTAVPCGAACTGSDGCGQCTPNAQTCSGSTERTCDAFGRETTRTCGNLGCSGGACVTCTPGPIACDNADPDSLVVCDTTGLSTDLVACPVGCKPPVTDGDAGVVEPAGCRNLVPSNGLTAACATQPSSYDFDLEVTSGTVTVDATAGTISGVTVPAGAFSTVAQPSAPTIGVFHVRRLIVAKGATLRVASGANAVAFVADGDVEIAGTIDVAGHLEPGGTDATHGPGPRTSGGGGSASGTVGAGGAGYGSKGGAGGGATAVLGVAGAVFPATNDGTLVPLVGGAPGGTFGANGKRGQGGGAIQIVSCTKIELAADKGLINAGGSGAPKSVQTSRHGGAGGGSGGAILLEAPSVIVNGLLSVAGGGGAGGGLSSATTGVVQGAAGEDAATFDCATGGRGGAGAVAPPDAPVGGVGGAGACGTGEAAAGLNGTGATGYTVAHGGGGGGGGRVRINRIDDFTMPAGSVSPLLSASSGASGTTFSTGPLSLE